MSRYYEFDDKKLPSVTSIISYCTDEFGLRKWAVNCAIDEIREWAEQESFVFKIDDFLEVLESAKDASNRISKEALEVGSDVHNYIEHYYKENKLTFLNSEQTKDAIYAFNNWDKDFNVTPIETEHTVYSDRWAGTLDLICDLTIKDDRKRYVIDFKTSKSLYKESSYQVAAYRSQCESDGCALVRLDKETGEYQFKDTTKTYEQDLKVFNLMAELFLERQPRVKKQVLG
ncbi:MAG: hypothetical protein GY861_16670 [bacterium]|nr:hypothetical protein [bacterium]